MSAQTNHVVGALALVLLATLAADAAAEGGSWWPGGSDKNKASVSKPADDSAMVDSPLFKMSWPKVEMPKFSWKPGDGGSSAAGSAQGNPISRALDKVADTSKKTSNNVRGMWDSTMSKLPFAGGGQATQTASNDKPGFWSRLMTPVEEPQGSETVQGFLAQERVGTVR